jgi:hypothetical protein
MPAAGRRSGRSRRPSPPPPRLPRLPPLRLAPVRSRGSVELDGARTKGGHELPRFERFDAFMRRWRWRQGEHATTIGPTGSGKTVLNRELLRRRDYVVILGVKTRDPELYGPFQAEGYELTSHFSPEPPAHVEQSKVLFVPRADGLHGTESRARKTKAFRQVLNDVEDVGYWCVYCDDVQYLADQLKLSAELEELWMIGRSEGVSVVASSQEPVNIPVMAYGMASHLFLFKNPDVYRARRMAELSGVNREIAEHAILRLPDHEFLYINKSSGEMLRSKVIRG